MEIGATPCWRSLKWLRRESDMNIHTCGFFPTSLLTHGWTTAYYSEINHPECMNAIKGSCIGQPWNRISFKISRAYPSVQLNVTFLLLSLVPSILSSPKDTSVISTLSKTDRLSADKTQFSVSSICLWQIRLTTSPQMFRRTLLRFFFFFFLQHTSTYISGHTSFQVSSRNLRDKHPAFQSRLRL